MHIQRRALLGTALTALALPARAAGSLRIGMQKNGSFVILRSQGTLEALFAPLGVAVSFVDFSAGPPMLEAINAGAIDVCNTGNLPPVFAQAAGVDMVYLAAQPNPGRYQAILVRDGGPVNAVADLKGRRVGVTKGTSAQILLATVLERAGLSMADIQPVLLQPSDGLAAFRSGSLDAWSIWDPLLAVGQQDPAARILPGSNEIATSNFFLGRRAWAEKSSDQVRLLLSAINGAADWARAHPDELAGLMATVTGVPLAAEKLAVPRGQYAALPMDAAVIAQQQGVADLAARLKIIPALVQVARAVPGAPA